MATVGPPRYAGLPLFIPAMANHVCGKFLNYSKRSQVYEKYLSVIRENPSIDKNNKFLWFIQDCYFDSMLVFIRAAVTDNGKKAESLVRLMTELESHADKVTKKQFVDSWDRCTVGWVSEGLKRTAEAHWKDFFGDADSLTKEFVKKEKEDLLQACVSIRSFVDKHVAHHEQNVTPIGVPLWRLESVFGSMYHFAAKYGTIFNDHPILITPPIGNEWLTIFDIPWRNANK